MPISHYDSGDAALIQTLLSIRRERGVTQEDLAAVIGVDRSAYSRIEAGTRTLTAIELLKLASALRIDPSHLIPEPLRDTPESTRVVIEGVAPEVDGGQFPAKRVIGERVVVEADVFADGHEALSGVLRYRGPGEDSWSEVPLEPLVNDRWRASFEVTKLGRYSYTLEAWLDPFKGWCRDLARRVEAGQDVDVELQIGAQLIEEAAKRAHGRDQTRLERSAALLRTGDNVVELALDEDLQVLVGHYPDRQKATVYPKELHVLVDPVRARYGAWYEMFPRSTSTQPGGHGTLKDCEARLDYVAEMGFDVLYLPPIHPIGQSKRKGPNNATLSRKGDPGSPWAIGSKDGGHKSIHPELGTIEDFRRLVKRANELSIDIALDVALQCSPDHPYVKEHPSWFRIRPGRHRPVRGKPTQEVRGHLPDQLRVGGLAGAMG